MIGIKEFSGFKDFGSGLAFCHTIFRFFFLSGHNIWVKKRPFGTGFWWRRPLHNSSLRT